MPLIIWHVIALLLAISWWFPETLTREFWNGIDNTFFFSLNGSLAEGGGWAKMWAIANHRLFDACSALTMLILYGHYALRENATHLVQRTALFMWLIIISLLVVQTGKTFLEIDRFSPSKVLQPAYLLTELFPGIDAKDKSSHSFPADHTTVLLLWTGFLWVFAGWRYGIIMAIAAIVFSLPRLVSGAHWLTDSIIGAGILVLPALAWCFFSPLCRYGENWMQRPAQWLVRLVTPVLTTRRLLR